MSQLRKNMEYKKKYGKLPAIDYRSLLRLEGRRFIAFQKSNGKLLLLRLKPEEMPEVPDGAQPAICEAVHLCSNGIPAVVRRSGGGASVRVLRDAVRFEGTLYYVHLSKHGVTLYPDHSWKPTEPFVEVGAKSVKASRMLTAYELAPYSHIREKKKGKGSKEGEAGGEAAPAPLEPRDYLGGLKSGDESG